MKKEMLECISRTVKERRLPMLRLPYESRSIDIAIETIERYVSTIHCNGKTFKILLFNYRDGIVNKIIACVGDEICINKEKIYIEDAMSGLRHSVYVPILRINECLIRPNWYRSRFVLRPPDLSQCRNCLEITL